MNWKTLARRYANGGGVDDDDATSISFDPKPIAEQTARIPKTPSERVMGGHQEFEQGYVPPGYSPWDVGGPWTRRPILNVHGVELEAIKSKRGGRIAPDRMKKVGGPLGHNTGGVFEDGKGKHYYVKRSKSEDVAKNEQLAAELYKAIGVPVVDHYMTTWKGKIAVVSKMLKGKPLKQVKKSTYPHIKHLLEDFPADVWLGNYDAVGLDKDNIVIGNDGVAYRVDVGASLTRRAKGGKKSWWGPKVIEFGAMLNPRVNKYANSVFNTKKLDPSVIEDIDRKRKRVAQKIADLSDKKIRDIVNSHGPGSEEEKHKLGDDLIARREQVAEHYGIKKKYQEGGPVEDVPGVGPVPAEPDLNLEPVQQAVEPVKKGAEWLGGAFGQMSRAVKMDPESRQAMSEAVLGKGLTGALQSPEAEAALGVVGGLPPGGRPPPRAPRAPPTQAPSMEPSAIANRLVEAHGNDYGTIISRLNDIRRLSGRPRSDDVFYGLPESHQNGIRSLNAADDFFRNITSPSEIEHLSDAYIGRMEHHIRTAGGPDQIPSIDQNSEIWKAYDERAQAKSKAATQQASEDAESSIRSIDQGAHPHEPIAAGRMLSLSEFTDANLSPGDVARLSNNQVDHLRDEIKNNQAIGGTAWENLQTYQPDLYDALMKRSAGIQRPPSPTLEETINHLLQQRDSLAARTQRMGVRPRTATPPEPEPDPGPFASISSGFKRAFDQHIAPLARWFHPYNEASLENFVKKYFGGLNTKQMTAASMYSGGIDISGELRTPEGEYAGRMSRQIYPERGYAHHDVFRLEPQFQDTDIAPRILRNQVDLYKEMGLDYADVYAALESGPYVWAKYGFVPERGSWDMIRGATRRLIDNNRIKITDPTTRRQVMDILSNEDPKAMWALVDHPGKDDLGNSIGKGIMLGRKTKGGVGLDFDPQTWNGRLMLRDPQAMERLDEWIKSRLQKVPKTP